MSLASAAQGKVIPEYTTQDAIKWVESGGSFLSSLIDISLIFFTLLGLLVFLLGLVLYMKASRDSEATAQGAGGSTPLGHGLWMMIGGGLLGSIGAIYLWIVGVLSL